MRKIRYHPAEMQISLTANLIFVVTVDGFLVSDNVTVEDALVLDTGFKWSDHNPVYMDFILE